MAILAPLQCASDHQVVLAAHIVGDRLVKAVPAIRTELETTMPNMEMTAASLAPPPMLTIMLPDGVPTACRRRAAAAVRAAGRPCEHQPDGRIPNRAAFDTGHPTGTLIMISGRRSKRLQTLEIKYRSIASVTT